MKTMCHKDRTEELFVLYFYAVVHFNILILVKRSGGVQRFFFQARKSLKAVCRVS